MKRYSAEKIRNVVLAGHNSTGKTTLVEALLFTSGAISRMGKVEDGNTVSDFEPEEATRKISISASLAPLEWKDHKINLIDTPGYADFVGEVISGTGAAETALILIDALSGVEVQTEKVLNYASEYNLSKIIFINKMDKENADFYQAFESVKEVISEASPLQIPIGKESSFEGVIDLVKNKALIEKEGELEEKEIPEELKEEAEKYREKLVEAVAETDDALLETYLEKEELDEADFKKGLKAGVLSGAIVPVVCGSASSNIGVRALLDTIVEVLPAPSDKGEVKGKNPESGEEISRKISEDEPFSALVFKTVTDPYVGKLNYIKVLSGILNADSTLYNTTQKSKEKVGHILFLRGKEQEETKEVPAGDIAVIPKLEVTLTGDTLSAEEAKIIYDTLKYPQPVFSVAIEPKTKGDEEKLSTSLTKLALEDPTLEVRRDTETKQTVVSGIGDLHLEVVLDRLKRRFAVEAELSAPKIPYKETIKSKARAQGKYKKQTGGRGQYGDCWLEVEPLERGGGFEFVDKIVGGAIPKGFIPGVEKGVKEAIEGGVLAGYPVVDVKVTLYDGSYHPVDSSELAFKIAGSMAFKKAASEANPVLLEPIVKMEIIVPEEFMGDVISDLSGKRGKVLGMEARGKNQVIKALAPLAEVAKYATELRSLTHGKGAYSIEFSHYEEVPKELQEKIVAESKKDAE